jgi:hypothetical protein
MDEKSLSDQLDALSEKSGPVAPSSSQPIRARVIRKGTILYHGTHPQAIPSIAKHGLEESGDGVIAGASGAWLSPSFNDVEGDWSKGAVAHFVVNKDLIIHPQFSDDSELGQIRRANQLVNEEYQDGPLDEDEIKDYGYEGVDRDKADNVSDILAEKGYHGHWDPFHTDHELAVYNSDNLTFTGHTDSERKFHPALGAQWTGK